jgi:hypothetical protein
LDGWFDSTPKPSRRGWMRPDEIRMPDTLSRHESASQLRRSPPRVRRYDERSDDQPAGPN